MSLNEDDEKKRKLKEELNDFVYSSIPTAQPPGPPGIPPPGQTPTPGPPGIPPPGQTPTPGPPGYP